MKSRLSLPLRVHSWGGLGSQLHTWFLVEELKEKYPRRKILWVHHSGGVTLREAELLDWSSADETIFTDDFIQSSKTPGPLQESPRPRFSPRSVGRRLLVQLAQRLGCVSRCNTNLEWISVKPWCLEIRGHYTSRQIKVEFAYQLSRLAVASGYRPLLHSDDWDHGGADVAIHWRYGDLADEKPDGVIPAEQVILTVFQTLGIDRVGQVCTLYSDSPDQATGRFKDAFPSHVSLDVVEADPWTSLCGLVNARSFIGSRSKLSIWAAAFRVMFDYPGLTMMPVETEAALLALLPGARQKIAYY